MFSNSLKSTLYSSASQKVLKLEAYSTDLIIKDKTLYYLILENNETKLETLILD